MGRKTDAVRQKKKTKRDGGWDANTGAREGDDDGGGEEDANQHASVRAMYHAGLGAGLFSPQYCPWRSAGSVSRPHT